MSYPTCTLEKLWQDLGSRFNCTRNATTGVLEPTILQKGVMADVLTDATRYIWELFSPSWVWPCTVTGATLTPSSGVLSWSSVKQSRWFSIWSEDPRTTYTGTLPATTPYEIRGTPDEDGVHVHDDSATVWVFYQKPAPQFSQLAVVGGTTYAAGDVVYDSATKDAYLSLGAYLGSALADTTKWTRQQLPEELRPLVSLTARAFSLKDNAGMRDSWAQEMQFVRLEYERMCRLYKMGQEPPWELTVGLQK